MASAWTDDEYGRVATALLYPSSRTFVVVAGFEPDSVPIGWQLDTRLSRLSSTAKAEVLTLADKVKTLRAAVIDAGSSCPEVSAVGTVKRDVMAGIRARRASLDEAVALLESLVDWHRNPNSNAPGVGGINGTCSP